MEKDKSRLLIAIIIGAALVLAVIQWFVLPERVAMQIQASGKLGNYMPKPVAIGGPLILTAGFGFIYGSSKDKKYLLVAVIGALLPIATIMMNC